MSTVLYNPTNEMFRITFGGRSFLLKGELSLDPREAPAKVKVTDACGRHSINELGPRGLMVLDFGDDEYEIGKQGQAVNQAFKVRQIENYNQQNEQRKAIGLPYTPPTKVVVGYARELGIKLNEPYRIEDLAITQSKELVKKLEEKDVEIAELKQGLADLIAAIKAGGTVTMPEETLKEKPTPGNEQDEIAPKTVTTEEIESVAVMSEDVEEEDEDLADRPKKKPKKGPKRRTTKK